MTDDPGTPGDGQWEINVGIGIEKRPGARPPDLSLVDLNYGIGDRLQLKYEVPYLRHREDGASSVSGFGNSAIGVKWRFRDAGETAWSVSVHPRLEFNTPGTIFFLPFQFERLAGPLRVIWQVGREFHPDGDAWLYGVAVGHRFSRWLEIAVELAGGGSPRFDRTQLTANLGVAIDFSARTSLLFSVGRELHNHAEPRAAFVGYLGAQWRL